tara:strand:+ start:1560 stop:2057 length:498 start_codon:yes stop_codon:yes gene_type:complete
MTLHFGYGSNLWFRQMDSMKRCPNNIKKGKGILRDWKWFIAERPGTQIGGAANIIKSNGDFVEGYVFDLSEEDEEKLDIREGTKYKKKYEEIEIDGRIEKDVMIYVDDENTNDSSDETKFKVNNNPFVCSVGCTCTYASRINKGIKDSGLSNEYIQRYIRKFIDE